MAAADAEALFAEHQQALLRYLCRAVGQAEAARDLAQDDFLSVSSAAVPVGSHSEQRSWIFRIARNLLIDHHRRRICSHNPTVAVWSRAHPASQDLAAAVNDALAALDDTG